MSRLSEKSMKYVLCSSFQQKLFQKSQKSQLWKMSDVTGQWRLNAKTLSESVQIQIERSLILQHLIYLDTLLILFDSKEQSEVRALCVDFWKNFDKVETRMQLMASYLSSCEEMAHDDCKLVLVIVVVKKLNSETGVKRSFFPGIKRI